jgi:glycosyltransferase involved in cell wall biosynthesis
LSEAGHQVLLHATGDSTCPVERTATFETARGVGIGGAAAEARHVIDAYDMARDWGADIVHDHTIVGPIYSQRFKGLPVVTTNHGPFDSDLGSFYRAVGGRVSIIAISADQASAAVNTPIAAVIHHGVDVEAFPFGGGDGGYALFLGRMSPDKGVAEAAHIAREADVPLRIAAKMREPAEQAYFDAEVRPLLGGGVDYIGEAGGAAKLALLAEATCLLNPICWREPFGMVMIEALACGTPVVATPCGAAPEIVDDGVTGYLRNGRGELAAAVVAAAALDRDACRQAAKERFSAARMAEDHLALFARVAHN